jgi:tetratricopeptide (TPR) repeat protein
LFSNKEYEKAIEKYSEAIELNDKNEVFYTNRAACYINIKKYEEALSDCKKAKKVNP